MSRVEYKMKNGRSLRKMESWIEIHLAGDTILEDLLGNELTKIISRKVQRGAFVPFAADVLTSTRFDENTSEVMRVVPSPFWGEYRGELAKAEEMIEREFKTLENIMNEALATPPPGLDSSNVFSRFGQAIRSGAADWGDEEPKRQQFDWDLDPAAGELEEIKQARRNDNAYCLRCNNRLPWAMKFVGTPPAPKELRVPGGERVVGWYCERCEKIESKRKVAPDVG